MNQRINHARIQNLTKIALCAALLCVSSYISIPLPFTTVMITAQTIVVNLLALILTPAGSAAAVGTYLLLGLVGVPVFAGGTAGIGKILSPSGGYYIGFLVAAVLISLLKGKKPFFPRYLAITVVVGIPVIYLFGVSFTLWFNKVNLWAALVSSVFPFIPGDILKCAAASLLAIPLNKALSKSLAS